MTEPTASEIPDVLVEPTPGLYRHFKGNLYRVIGMAQDADGPARLVIYMPAHGPAYAQGKLWYRSLSRWCDFVLPAGSTAKVPRFQREDSHA